MAAAAWPTTNCRISNSPWLKMSPLVIPTSSVPIRSFPANNGTPRYELNEACSLLAGATSLYALVSGINKL